VRAGIEIDAGNLVSKVAKVAGGGYRTTDGKGRAGEESIMLAFSEACLSRVMLWFIGMGRS
jgi:hypothetical protein